MDGFTRWSGLFSALPLSVVLILAASTSSRGQGKELHAKFLACSYCRCQVSEGATAGVPAGRVFIKLRIEKWDPTNHTGYPAWVSYRALGRNGSTWTEWSESLVDVSELRISSVGGKLTPERPKPGDLVSFEWEFMATAPLEIQARLSSQNWHDGSGACHQTSSEHWLTIETGEAAVHLPGKKAPTADGKGAVAPNGNDKGFDFLSPTQLNKRGMYAAFETIGTPMTLRGRSYRRYVLQHPGTEGPIDVAYQLDGRASRFTATVGIDQSMNPGDVIRDGATVEYLVYTDGRLVWRSGVVTLQTAARSVDVDLTGVKELKLVVTDAGDGIGHDWAIWADPVIR